MLNIRPLQELQHVGHQGVLGPIHVADIKQGQSCSENHGCETKYETQTLQRLIGQASEYISSDFSAIKRPMGLPMEGRRVS